MRQPFDQQELEIRFVTLTVDRMKGCEGLIGF